MSLALPVEAVADTAFLTAYCRALEGARPDAHFRDPYASLLAEPRGRWLMSRLPGQEASAAGCIVRTCLLDDFILEILQESAVDAVVNLGAGLDTRPYRLPMPPEIRWIEVDDAAVLEYKARTLAGYGPSCRLEAIPRNLADADARQSLFHDIGATARHVLVITEGLLIYLTRDQAAGLARDLHRVGSFRWWLTDIASPQAMQLLHQMLGDARPSQSVRLRFAAEDVAKFFGPLGWDALAFRSCMEEGRRLERWLMPEPLVAACSKEQWGVLRNLSGVVKLRRIDTGAARSQPVAPSRG